MADTQNTVPLFCVSYFSGVHSRQDLPQEDVKPAVVLYEKLVRLTIYKDIAYIRK
jgi:hypothetical protein